MICSVFWQFWISLIHESKWFIICIVNCLIIQWVEFLVDCEIGIIDSVIKILLSFMLLDFVFAFLRFIINLTCSSWRNLFNFVHSFKYLKIFLWKYKLFNKSDKNIINYECQSIINVLVFNIINFDSFF